MSGGVLEWVKGLGLPIASLIASGAFFGIQMQQQAFERKLNNVENGYRFYFEKRTPLASSNDAMAEIALLQMIGAAFPNVYCNVRADMFKRVDAIEVPDNPAPGLFSRADQNLLRSFVRANQTPQSAEFSTDFGSVLLARANSPSACMADFDTSPTDEGPLLSAAPGATVEQSTSETAPTLAAPESPAPSVAAESVELRRQQATLRVDRSNVRFDPSQLSLRAQTFRVFFHVREGGRDPASIDPLRAPLAEGNFRVMRDVQVISAANFPRQAEVRHFGGEADTQAANELAAALNQQFAGQMRFTTRAIGQDSPNLPPQNIEVWVP